MYELEEGVVNSLVGYGSRFRGHVELSGMFRIDGQFIGSIRIDGQVIIGKSAHTACSVEASVVVVGGVFCGTIRATDRVILLSSCLIIGSIISPRLVAETGCRVNGELSIVPTGKHRDHSLLNVAHKQEQHFLQEAFPPK